MHWRTQWDASHFLNVHLLHFFLFVFVINIFWLSVSLFLPEGETLPWWQRCVRTVLRSRDWGQKSRRTPVVCSCHVVSSRRGCSIRTRWGRVQWGATWQRYPPTWTSGGATWRLRWGLQCRGYEPEMPQINNEIDSKWFTFSKEVQNMWHI